MNEDGTPSEGETPLDVLTDLLKGQRRRWRRWFAGVLVVMAGMGFFLVRTTGVAHEAKAAAKEAQAAADKAQRALDRTLVQRQESRVNICLKDKKFAEAHNSLVYALAHSDPSRTQTAQAGVDAQAAPHYVEVPDCSPQGIAAFYAGQGGTTAPDVPDEPPAPSTTTTVRKPTHRRATSTTGTTSPSSTTHPTTASTFPTPETTEPCVVSVPMLPCL